MANHKLPKGYKTWTILNKMNEVNGMTYTEIIKLAYELSHGAGSFDKRNNRGYWSGAFVQAGPGSFRWSFNSHSGPMAKYADKGNDGKYRVNGNGMVYISEYWTAFKNLKVETEKESVKVNEFNERYSKQLNRFEKNQELKSDNKESEIYSDILHSATQTGLSPSPEEMAMAIREESQKETSPEVRLRGLQLDDKVAYRKTRTNESGVGVIDMVRMYGKNIANSDDLHIGINNGTIPVSYNAKEDKFYHAYAEIQIIKI